MENATLQINKKNCKCQGLKFLTSAGATENLKWKSKHLVAIFQFILPSRNKFKKKVTLEMGQRDDNINYLK